MTVYSRFCCLLLFSMLSTILPSTSSVKAQDGDCALIADKGMPTVCRTFAPDEEGRHVSFFFAKSRLYPNVRAAQKELRESLDRADPDTVVDTRIIFGDEQVATYLQGNTGGKGGVATLSFRVGSVVAFWLIIANDVDPVKIAEATYRRLDQSSLESSSDSELLLATLPTEADVPNYLSITDEDLDGIPHNDRSTEGGRSASQGELSILSIETKDAGIGDGTIYVYVEVHNGSDQTIRYVGIEGTCRSSDGRVVGTGIGSTGQVAPGETVVITMIMLQVPACKTVEARFDALTGAI